MGGIFNKVINFGDSSFTLHLSQFTPCLSPKNSHNLCLISPGYNLQSSQEKLKTLLMQNSGGKEGVICNVQMANGKVEV